MRLKIYKMATSILLRFLTLKCGISRTIWRIEVSGGSLFCIFHTLLFELNLFFDLTCPLTSLVANSMKQYVFVKITFLKANPGWIVFNKFNIYIIKAVKLHMAQLNSHTRKAAFDTCSITDVQIMYL